MNNNTNINTDLSQIVSQHFEQIKKLEIDKKEQTSDLYSQIRSIESSFNSQVRNVENKLDDLKEKYSEMAHELAIEEGECPRSRWGGYLSPNEVDIKATGIVLTWIQSNPYGCDNYDYFEATWDNLLAYEAKQNESQYTEEE